MRRWAIGLVVVLVLLALIGLRSRARPTRGPNPGEMETAGVERGVVRLTVSADGVLQPLTTVAVKS